MSSDVNRSYFVSFISIEEKKRRDFFFSFCLSAMKTPLSPSNFLESAPTFGGACQELMDAHATIGLSVQQAPPPGDTRALCVMSRAPKKLIHKNINRESI